MAEVVIQIPKLSLAVHEATPIEFLVPDGGHVNEGEPLFLVETEKTETDVAATATGTVHWEVELDTAYPVGTRAGYIETAD